MGTYTEYVMCIISTPADNAPAIARTIVEKKLAACAQVSAPVRSFYWWQNAIHEDEEVLIYLKTKADKTEAVSRLCAEIHPYEVPEFIVVPIADGAKNYLDWIEKTIN